MENFTIFVAGAEWIWIAILVAIAAIVVRVIISKRKNKMIEVDTASDEVDIDKISKKQNEKSLKTLKERLAKGEITKEEYKDLKSALE